jgi:hypothetical protein
MQGRRNSSIKQKKKMISTQRAQARKGIISQRYASLQIKETRPPENALKCPFSHAACEKSKKLVVACCLAIVEALACSVQ